MSRFVQKNKMRGGAASSAPYQGKDEDSSLASNRSNRPGFAAPTSSAMNRGQPSAESSSGGVGSEKIGLNERQRALLQQLNAQKQAEARSALSKTKTGSPAQNKDSVKGKAGASSIPNQGVANGIPLRSNKPAAEGESRASMLLAQLKKRKAAQAEQPQRRGGLSLEEDDPLSPQISPLSGPSSKSQQAHSYVDGSASPMPPPPPSLATRGGGHNDREYNQTEAPSPHGSVVSFLQNEAAAEREADSDAGEVMSEHDKAKRERKERKEGRRREKEEKRGKSKEPEVMRPMSYHYRGGDHDASDAGEYRCVLRACLYLGGWNMDGWTLSGSL